MDTTNKELDFVANPNSDFDPEEISRLLSIKPDHTTKLGEKRKIGPGNYPFSTWYGCRKEKPDLDIQEQVENIVKDLKDKISILKRIKEKYDVNFFIISVPSVYHEKSPNIYYSKEIIDFCYETGTELGIHLYVFDKEVD